MGNSITNLFTYLNPLEYTMFQSDVQEDFCTTEDLTDLSTQRGKEILKVLEIVDHDQLVSLVGKCDLTPIIKYLANFARDHLDLVRLSKNKFSKGWHGYEAAEDPVLNLVQIEERITEILVPTKKDKNGARYIKRILTNLPVDQMGGFVADDTRSNPVKAFIDVLLDNKNAFLARIIAEDLAVGGFKHFVEFDMDPEAVLDIIRSQSTKNVTWVNSRIHTAAPIKYMKLRNECVVFYTNDYTLAPHSLEQISAQMTVMGQETHSVNCEKYASAYSVFEVHGPGEFSEGSVVIGCHLSSCGSLEDVMDNQDQYVFMSALARSYPEGTLFMGDFNVALFDETRFKPKEDMRKEWPVQFGGEDIPTNMTFGYVPYVLHDPSKAPSKRRAYGVSDNVQAIIKKMGDRTDVTDFIFRKGKTIGDVDIVFRPQKRIIPYKEDDVDGVASHWLTDHPDVGGKDKKSKYFVGTSNALANGACERPFFNRTLEAKEEAEVKREYEKIFASLITSVFG